MVASPPGEEEVSLEAAVVPPPEAEVVSSLEVELVVSVDAEAHHSAAEVDPGVVSLPAVVAVEASRRIKSQNVTVGDWRILHGSGVPALQRPRVMSAAGWGFLRCSKGMKVCYDETERMRFFVLHHSLLAIERRIDKMHEKPIVLSASETKTDSS